MWGKNDAVPANALPVPPLPAPTFERFDIALKGIIGHLAQPCANEFLSVTREPTELPCGVF
jgi:hypothetical protein